MRRVITYFYTGTGNSFRIATFLDERARSRGHEANLLSSELVRPNEIPALTGEDHLNVVFPTHGFTAPWKMIKTSCRIRRGHSAGAFVVATRAGIKVGRFHPPGLSGTATFLIALILFFKGYRAQGALSVNMPSNWFSLHPMQSRASHNAIAERSRTVIEERFARVLDGKRLWLTLNNLYELIGGLALLPVSVAYLFMGRFFLAKLFFANGRCKGCALCERDCPVGAISMWRGKPYWSYACESCMRCAGFCPKNAIEAGHSWGVLLYFATSIPISIYAFAIASERFGLATETPAWLGAVLDTLYFYPSLVCCYALFALANRAKPFNWLFTKTTLTHYWGRHREAGTRRRHLRPNVGAASEELE